jgi:F-box interacting protein
VSAPTIMFTYYMKVITAKRKYTVPMDGGSFREFKKHERPCQIGGRHYKVFDCKGLILIMTMRKESDDFAPLILWNPAIRIYISLPRPSIGLPSANYRVYHGFGFDHTSNDYKVLRMVYVNNKLFPPQVELYKLRTGTWERVRVAHDFPNVVPATNTHAYVNGASHWIGLQKRDMGLMASGSYKRVIVLFHMCDEELRVMKLPDHLSRPTYIIAQIGVSGGLLFVMEHSRQQFNYLVDINIWLMKEYGVVESWTKQFIIHLRGIYGFRNNEKILGRKQGKPFLYDLNTHRFINLGIKVQGLIFPENTFNESLVLLNEATLQTCQTCLKKCQWCDSKKERVKRKGRYAQ